MPPKPKFERKEVFGGKSADTPSPRVPYVSVSGANRVYEEGGLSIPDADFVDPLEVENTELRGQLTQLMEQLQSRTSDLLVQDGTLMVQGFKFSPTGLVAPDDMTPEVWEQIGLLLFRLEGSIQWLIGDWLVYGADLQYGDVKQIAQSLGRHEQTFYNIMDVCRGIESYRRREHLSFAHHSEVKKLTPENQTWALEFAERERLNVKQFRQWIKQGMPETGLSKGSTPTLPPTTGETFIKPLFSVFKSLMQRDPVEAEEYVAHLERAVAEMRTQLKERS